MVYLISQIFQPTTRTRHSGMDAGIQWQGVRVAHLKTHPLNGFFAPQAIIVFYLKSIGFLSLAWLWCAMRTSACRPSGRMFIFLNCRKAIVCATIRIQLNLIQFDSIPQTTCLPFPILLIVVENPALQYAKSPKTHHLRPSLV